MYYFSGDAGQLAELGAEGGVHVYQPDGRHSPRHAHRVYAGKQSN